MTTLLRILLMFMHLNTLWFWCFVLLLRRRRINGNVLCLEEMWIIVCNFLQLHSSYGAIHWKHDWRYYSQWIIPFICSVVTQQSTNSRRPLDRLKYICTLLWPCDVILNGSPGLPMNYPCGKFGDVVSAVQHSAVLNLSCRHTHRQSQTRMNALLPRLSSAWVTICSRLIDNENRNHTQTDSKI